MASELNLLYPEGAPEGCADPNFNALCAVLGLDQMILPNVGEFFTNDPDVIRYRSELISVILKSEQLLDALNYMREKLREFQSMKNNTRMTSREQQLNALLNAGFYVEFIVTLAEKLEGVSAGGSQCLRQLIDFVTKERGSERFKALKENLDRLDSKVLHIRSVTLGVNFNPQLRPIEAGIVSLNDKPFLSDNLIDRLLRLDFEKDDMHCIAPLTAVKGVLGYDEQLKLNDAIYNSIDSLIADSLRKSRVSTDKYFYDQMRCFSELGRQADFLVRACGFLQKLRSAGMPLTAPQITDGEYLIENLYNPDLALRLEGSGAGAKTIVKNRVKFDDDGRIYILTGPNSGGKTVYIRALAYAQAMLQLGLPIPAASAKMTVCRKILTMFPKEYTEGAKSGRLEEECIELAGLLEKCDRTSLVLMDEVFSSTSAADGVVLAGNALKKLKSCGCMCVFSTHLHELCDRVGELNSEPGSRVDLLAAEIIGKERTYNIIRGQRSNVSDAFSIAEKYGLMN